MIDIQREFAQLDELYRSLPMRPLRVTVALETELVAYDPIHLDNVLAAGLVRSVTRGHGLDPDGAPWSIPLPLGRLWSDPATDLVLWAATAFEAAGQMDRSVSHTHRRTLRSEFVQDAKDGRPFNPNPALGRFKETRIPFPALVCERLAADCIGHRELIESLLVDIAHLGKRRAEGKGLVRHWCVEPIDDFVLWAPNGEPRRALPMGFLSAIEAEAPADRVARVGWTPPYWSSVPECRADGIQPRFPARIS